MYAGEGPQTPEYIKTSCQKISNTQISDVMVWTKPSCQNTAPTSPPAPQVSYLEDIFNSKQHYSIFINTNWSQNIILGPKWLSGGNPRDLSDVRVLAKPSCQKNEVIANFDVMFLCILGVQVPAPHQFPNHQAPACHGQVAPYRQDPEVQIDEC